MLNNNYKNYMNRVLELAANGWGYTSPNPMVGAVLVKNGKVVAEGCHEGAGKDHAEVVAIKKAGSDASGADLIVNLEPCCHHGRTPPCTDLIIKAGIKKVVYGAKDPNSKVNGKGLELLKSAGVEVHGPVLEAECRSFNRIYFHWIKTGLPYVISKVAISLDGKIAPQNGNSKWITNEKCRARMHYWRAGVDAVLVGAETVRKDDPFLSVRNMENVRQPHPVIITLKGEIDRDRRIWERKPEPILICGEDTDISHLSDRSIDVVRVATDGMRLDLKLILAELGKKGISSILIEGGGDVHSQLMETRLASYMVASLSTNLIGSNGRDWLPGWSVNEVSDSPKLNPDQILVLDDNVVIEGEINY